MATVYGSMMVEYSGATGGWKSFLTYSTSLTDTAMTITASGGIASDYWSFAITSGITSTLSCTGQSSASGSGGLSSQWSSDVNNKLVSKTYTITRTSSAQSITLSCKTVNSSGYINGTSTATATITVPALESGSSGSGATYTVLYSANGGIGAPASQQKTSGTALVLSGDEPTRTDYEFLGWATAPNLTEAAYLPSASYETDADVWLYAVWRFAGAQKRMRIRVPDGAAAKTVYVRQ